MKKLLSLVIVALLFACEGPEGPRGATGPAGGLIVAESFEETVDLILSEDNYYQYTMVVPLSIELYESDMVLVYRLKGQVDGYDVWQLLPETVYTSSGDQFQYNYEHNFDYITVYIDSSPNFDYNELLPSDIQNQTFRAVILPVDFISSNRININNYNEVEKYLKK